MDCEARLFILICCRRSVINVRAEQLIDGHIGIYFERWLMAEVKDVCSH